MARPGLYKNTKFRKLCRLLALPAPYVRAHLEEMWEVAYEDGRARLGSAEDVEIAANWHDAVQHLGKKPGEFFKAILACGFLDELGGDRYGVHDLMDHAPDYVRRRKEREESRKSRTSGTSGKNSNSPADWDLTQNKNGATPSAHPLPARTQSAPAPGAHPLPAPEPDTFARVDHVMSPSLAKRVVERFQKAIGHRHLAGMKDQAAIRDLVETGRADEATLLKACENYESYLSHGDGKVCYGAHRFFTDDDIWRLFACGIPPPPIAPKKKSDDRFKVEEIHPNGKVTA